MTMICTHFSQSNLDGTSSETPIHCTAMTLLSSIKGPNQRSPYKGGSSQDQAGGH